MGMSISFEWGDDANEANEWPWEVNALKSLAKWW